jgi:hypothetical protein
MRKHKYGEVPDDARAAAERIFTLANMVDDEDTDLEDEALLAEEAASCGMVVARAYLEEHLRDDAEIADDQWLDAVVPDANFQRMITPNLVTYAHRAPYLCAVTLCRPVTRGQVRMVFRAIRRYLKE